MSTSKLLGIALLLGGVICMTIAYQWSESAGDQVKRFFTGEFRDATIWLGLIGVLAAILGVVALVTGRRGS